MARARSRRMVKRARWPLTVQTQAGKSSAARSFTTKSKAREVGNRRRKPLFTRRRRIFRRGGGREFLIRAHARVRSRFQYPPIFLVAVLIPKVRRLRHCARAADFPGSRDAEIQLSLRALRSGDRMSCPDRCR